MDFKILLHEPNLSFNSILHKLFDMYLLSENHKFVLKNGLLNMTNIKERSSVPSGWHAPTNC